MKERSDAARFRKNRWKERSDAARFRKNRWKVGDVLEASKGLTTEQVIITAIGEQLVLCRTVFFQVGGTVFFQVGGGKPTRAKREWVWHSAGASWRRVTP